MWSPIMELAGRPMTDKLIDYAGIQNLFSLRDITCGEHKRDSAETNMLADGRLSRSKRKVICGGQHAFGNGALT